MRKVHPGEWKGGIELSLPEGTTIEQLGTSEPRADAGKKKKAYESPEQAAVRKQKQRDSYHRNKWKKQGKPAPSLPMLSRIKFCPECGCNLEIFQIALGMAEKAQGDNK
jgi:hypothetical protein